jgi:hypothetical protein
MYHHRWLALTLIAFGFTIHCALAASIGRPPTLAPAPAISEEERILASFKAKAAQFERFLANQPRLLVYQNYLISPTGFLYYHVRLTLLSLGFDVQRSDSLVSPFVGYLYLHYEVEDTTSCSDDVANMPQVSAVLQIPKMGMRGIGYSTYQKAMARADTCWAMAQRDTVQEVRLSFVYQDGRWVFKDAVGTKDHKPQKWLMAAMGRLVDPSHRHSDNQAWEDLVR